MKGGWCYLLYTILVFCINHCGSTAVGRRGNDTDRLALMAFKDGITSDRLGMLSSWNDSLHHCRWSGVNCGRRHGDRVTGLNLNSYGLVGSLSKHIGNLTFLRTIILQNNSFHGKVPSEIGGLFRLEYLQLSNNSFQGYFPINLTNCLKLWFIDLIDNKLQGRIPAELGSLPKLQVLGVADNYFTGSIPASLGNLSDLFVLSLADNSLEGSIPEELGRNTGMEFLQFGYNKLTGTIPSSIYNLSLLYDFETISNQLEGNIHQNIGLTLPHLSMLSFAFNRFTGPIPPSLSNASSLEYIQFVANKFTGTVPGDLGKLQNLKVITMADNQLGDDLSFIPPLTNCTQLEYFNFGDNFLRGSLVSSIANLSNRITGLVIGGNQIHGTIPPGIENLVNLNFLDMGDNHLTGSIPPNIGKLRKLQELYLGGNKLSGRIPSSLGNLTLLNYLFLNLNNLFGEIPPSLAACQSMSGLDFSHNNLNGSIIPRGFLGPSSITVDLSGNAFTGLLPLEVGNLINLIALNVSNNRLAGELPSTLAKCVMIEDLRLHGNSFQGEIPAAWRTLGSLEYLDLSHNNFSGHIPAFLGKLHFLTYLNLSFNKLDGEVPKLGIFGNATIVSVQGNYNLCGGIPQLHLPTCPTSSTAKKERHLVVKIVMPVIAAICLSLLAVFFIVRHRRRKSRKNIVSSSQLYNSQFRRISYSDLHKATGGFSESNIIGVGSYGSVYKGVLHQDGTAIAIKVFDLHRRGASKSFMSECKALRKIRHRNLVKILSACSSLDFKGNDFKAIVFELMPLGSLEDWLHPEVEEAPKRLNILQRLNIAIDVASALDYLHNHCDDVIIHSDLKPSNVLLDDDMTAHVSDFGLAKIISIVSSTTTTDTSQSSSTAMKGSVGYIAPEYGVGGTVSVEGDVYSYGILLLEMFTGRRPTYDNFPDGLMLHNFVKNSLPDRVMEVVDPYLHLEDDGGNHKMEESMVSVLRIGVTCSIESAKDRMEMAEVVKRLQSIRNMFSREAIHGDGQARGDNSGEGTSYLS